MGQIIPLQKFSNTPEGPTPHFPSIVQNFLESQDVKQSSRSLYKRTLRQFFKWMKQRNYVPQDLKRADIIQYKKDLLDLGLSSLTVGSYLSVVRKFYEWLEANRFFPNVAKGIKTPGRYKGFKKDPLSIEQIKDLLLSVDTTTIQGKRDFALINLLLRGGLRTIEACRANVGDIGQKCGETVLYIQGKGCDTKDAYVLLTKKAYEPILDYLQARGNTKPSDPLFASMSKNSNGKRLTTRSISQIAKDGILKIGVDSSRITAHSLRHTAGINVLRAGGDLYETQLFMRHEDPSTTQIYLRTVEDEIKMKSAPQKLLDSIF